MADGAVDLRSDTVTRPTPAMREAMADAEVGDDLLDGDPTTRRLEERVAALLGKPGALFLPSGVMANQIALAVLGEPGTEVVLEAGAHIFHYEEAAAARLTGLQLRPVPTPDGRLTGARVEEAIRPDSPYVVRTSLVCLENTHLQSGGRVAGARAVDEVGAVARRHGLPLHLDGARLWHAAVAREEEPARLAAAADTVMVALSKGLGAPVGSVLAGAGEVIDRAWRVRRRFGGGMRQSGVLAAAGLHALDHHLARLVQDHRNAGRLAAGLDELPGVSVVPPETNIVLVELSASAPDPATVVEGLEERGIRMIHFGPRQLRAVTHLDVDRAGVDRAVEAFGEVVEAGPSSAG